MSNLLRVRADGIVHDAPILRNARCNENNIAFNTVHSTADSLSFDAFYADEFGVANTPTNIHDSSASSRVSIHKNRFTVTTSSGGSITESSKNTATLLLQNQANPNFNLGLGKAYRQTQIPPPPYADKHNVQMYFSGSVLSAVAKGTPITISVVVLYAVGTELNRHGLRGFFEKAGSPRALIVVPGTEPPRDPDRWGIAISDAQIKALINEQFKKDVDYKVTVLAGFSTGGCGLHQTLLHNLLKIDALETIVYFDCLYENQCSATPASKALKNLRSMAPNVKIVVYKTSEGGNDYADSLFTRLTVVANNSLIFDSRGVVTNLFQQTDFISLVCFRSLQAAALDGIATIPKAWEKAFKDLEAALVPTPRGTFISNKVAYDYVHGTGTNTPPAGKAFFEDWAKTNKSVLSAFTKHLGLVSVVDTVRFLLWRNQLPGWPGGDGEEKHDLLPPEFGWEFLM